MTTPNATSGVGKVHLQPHHPLRPGRQRPCWRGVADRQQARGAPAAVPPAPRCLPNATRRGGLLFAHAEACGFGHRKRHRTPISGSIKIRVLTRARARCECCRAGYCSANPAPKGPGGGPHHPQKPGQFGRPQQPAGPLLPLQCRQAMGGASKPTAWRAHRRAEIGAAEHVRNSMLGSGQRTNRDEILITNRSEAAA
jgi:hypothetical protein